MRKFFDYLEMNDWAFVLFPISIFAVSIAFIWFISRLIRERDKKRAIENHVEKWRH